MPKLPDKSPSEPKESSLRTALRAVLASGLIFISSGDSHPPAQAPKRQNYEHLFKGIEILPPGSPKGKPAEEMDDGEGAEPRKDSDSEDQLPCNPSTCQYG